MKKKLITFSFFVFFLTHLYAETAKPQIAPINLEDLPLFQSAKEALRDHFPEIAREHLRELVKNPSLSKDNVAQKKILFLRVHACIQDNALDKALELLNNKKLLLGDPEIFYWQAMAYVAKGHYTKASASLEKYIVLPNETLPYFENASFLYSSLLLSLGKSEEALSILERLERTQKYPSVENFIRQAEILLQQKKTTQAVKKLRDLPPEKKISPLQHRQKNYLLARIALEQGRHKLAVKLLQEELAKSTSNNTPSSLTQNLQIALVQGLYKTGQPSQAMQLLHEFIEENPTSALAPLAFEHLKESQFFHTPETQETLRRWSQSTHKELAALASFYLAQNDPKNLEKTQQLLEEFLSTFPNHYLAAKAQLKMAQNFLSKGEAKKASKILLQMEENTLSPKIKSKNFFLKAYIALQEKQFKQAALLFRKASQYGAPSLLPVSLYNSALAWTQAAVELEFLHDFRLLQTLPEQALDASLFLERALFQASHKEPLAAQNLEQFLTLFPKHPRAIEAKIALIELHIQKKNTPPEVFTQYFKELEKNFEEQPSSIQEKITTLHFWGALYTKNYQSAEQHLNTLIEQWPNSSDIPQLRMKLGEAYYQAQNFSKAQNQFSLLSEEFSTHPLAEAAYFFAGKAAYFSMNEQSIDTAIKFWGKVVEYNGSLALQARLQQALAKQRLNEPSAAIALFDEILEEKNLDPELRNSILCAKGQNYYLLANTTSEEKNKVSFYQKALKSFDSILQDTQASLQWKHQALYRKGKCLEKTNQTETAIRVYYAALKLPTTEKNTPTVIVNRWTWRCANAAINLLKKESRWEAALALTEKISTLAPQYTNQNIDADSEMRLENFIWKNSSNP